MSEKTKNAKNMGTMKLSGDGTATARPDVAEVGLGVVTEATAASVAMLENAQRMNEVIARIKALGVPSENLQTTGISLSPVYDNDEKSSTYRQLIGYRVEDSVSVRSEVDLAGAVLDAGVRAGANLTSGIRFRLMNDAPLRDKALSSAVESAQHIAQVAAKAMGAKLLPPYLIEISGSSVSNPSVMMKSMESATSIEPGMISVRASVRVERHYFIAT